MRAAETNNNTLPVKHPQPFSDKNFIKIFIPLHVLHSMFRLDTYMMA